MPLPDSLTMTLHYGDRVEGIVHASSPVALDRVNPFAPSAAPLQRDQLLPMVELSTEGRAVLTLAQLKGLLHTLEAAISEDEAHGA